MDDPRILRAQQLLEQNRYPEAEKELKTILSSNPDDQLLLSMMSLCMAGLERYAEAEALIRRCIAKEPYNSWYLFMYGDILMLKRNFSEAEEMARKAIAMTPDDASYRALLSNSLLARKRYEEALQEAGAGLALDPENIICLNLRSTILITLGRKEEGFAAINEALEQDPENSHTHANYGWSELHRGDHRKALEHFREALRHDPGNEYAKAGLVEALQARYLIYRWFLKYYFWMSRMQGSVQWAVIIGFYIGQQALGSLAASYPALEPFITPIIILYIVFALSTWVIQPLFNLFLRLNKYGRFALSQRQTTASNFVGSALAVGIVSGILYLITDYEVFGFAGIAGLILMLPLGTMLLPFRPERRKVLVGATLVVGGLAIAGVVNGIITGVGLNNLAYAFFISVFIYQFVANWAISTD